MGKCSPEGVPLESECCLAGKLREEANRRGRYRVATAAY